MDLDALILSYIIDIWYIDTLDYNVLPKWILSWYSIVTILALLAKLMILQFSSWYAIFQKYDWDGKIWAWDTSKLFYLSYWSILNTKIHLFLGGYFLFKECNPPQIFGFLCMLVEIVICLIPAMLGFQKLMTLARGHLELASSNKSHYWQTWESSILATDVL